MNNKLMCHFIAGYPTVADSLEIGRIMAGEGASYLEIQFPFSDPSADGPAIQEACTKALDAGFTVAQGFELIHTLSQEFDIPLFIMSYSTIAYRHGIEDFLLKAKKAGAAGVIIPDLLPPDDEQLFVLAEKYGLDAIPVFPVTIDKDRLDIIRNLKTKYMYVALRRGITGKKTEISREQIEFLDSLKQDGVTILAGFGIQERSQVEAVVTHVDAAILGSVLVNTIKEAGASYKKALTEKLKDLL